MQFGFEFFLGGIMKPDSGVLFKAWRGCAGCQVKSSAFESSKDRLSLLLHYVAEAATM